MSGHQDDVLGSLSGNGGDASLPGAGSVPDRTADVSVRPAVAEDAEVIARLQVSAWQRTAETLAPDAELSTPSQADVAASWRASISSPPDRRHHVLVAVAGPEIVGFAALVPTEQRPLEVVEASPATSREATGGAGLRMEILGLEVDPSRLREGHGSRLLAACADIAAEDGAASLQTWAARDDEQRTRFLSAAGFGPSGLRRVLESPDGRSRIDEVCWYAGLGEPDPGD